MVTSEFRQALQRGLVIPIIGFYLQPSVGGRILPHSFWRRFVEIPAVAAIKIAPFNRYQTLDVIRAVSETDRDDLALFTGNADNIDAANGFRGCIAGIHELLRRQGLLEGIWCLESGHSLSPGQREEIERVHMAYPHLFDDAFIDEHRDAWFQP